MPTQNGQNCKPVTAEGTPTGEGTQVESLEGSVGIVQAQRVQLFTADRPLQLDCGKTLGPIDVVYETYGRLNEARDNAILICHALSGDAHVAGRHSPEDRKPGWWDMAVGPGKPFDTDRYFVICSNCLGGCMGTTGPGSTDPLTGKPYGMNFPMITISDMVDVQRELIRHLGIDKLLAVAGGSMGGMQVLDWAVRYPECTLAAIPIATTSRLSAQAIAFDAVGRNAILTDEKFAGGDYYQTGSVPGNGLAVARMVGHITYLSEETMHTKFGRQLRDAGEYQYQFKNEFSVETYLDYQGTSFVDRFDANTYLYFSKAMDYFDLGKQHGDLYQAMAQTRGRFLVISYNSDWLFPPRQSREIVDALQRHVKDVSYCEIDCPYGHDSFLLEDRIQGSLIRAFLRQTHHYYHGGRCCDSPACGCTSLSGQPSPSMTENVGSIFTGERVDHRMMAQLIAPESTVLDLGCGNGDLLVMLRDEKNIHGLGMTLNQDDVLRCVARCISVVQQDIDEGLSQFADQSYDVVVLSQTLQVIPQPERVLKEMLRVGKKVIVSFPNFAYWQSRLQILAKGRAPVWRALPYAWFDKESINYLSIADFETFVKERLNARLVRRVPINSRKGHVIKLWPNLRADEAIYVIARNENA